jgi:hypothetical protein
MQSPRISIRYRPTSTHKQAIYMQKHAIYTHNKRKHTISTQKHVIYRQKHANYTHKHPFYMRGNGLIDALYCVKINTNENSIPCLAAVGNLTGNGHCFNAASLRCVSAASTHRLLRKNHFCGPGPLSISKEFSLIFPTLERI